MTAGAEAILGALGWASIGDFTRRIETDALDGELRDVAAALNLLLDDLADLDRQRREAEELRSAAAAALTVAQARAQLLAELGHELRTPLNSIVGIAQLLVEPTDGHRADNTTLTQDLQASADHLLGLVDDLLLQARLEAGTEILQPGPTDIPALLRGCVDLVGHRPGNPAGVELRLEDAADVTEVIADELRLRQVLLNLLTNALRATTEGTVTLRARTEGERLRFAVADTGRGMSDEELALVFEPFTQAGGRTIDGTGLGLTISRRIVEAMGGSLLAVSEPGVGSTFTFSIPLVLPEAPSVTPAPDPAADPDPDPAVIAADTPPLRILVAEDHVTTQIVTRRLLERSGHTVTIVGDGRAAVDTALAGDHDVVLLDMRMPILTGLDAARAIRLGWPANRARIVLIGLTADATPEDREAGLQAGLDDYIAKPFRIGDLNARLHALVG